MRKLCEEHDFFFFLILSLFCLIKLQRPKQKINKSCFTTVKTCIKKKMPTFGL